MSPLRAALIGGGVLVVAALAWYLGSPLFIRTTVVEAPPSAAPVVLASPSAGASARPTPAGPVIQARGELQYVDQIHNGKGAVQLIRTGDATVLRFDDVAITNAPDVHVYLSKESGGKWSEATSLYLGPLKATNGSFNYPVQAADVATYQSVVVWCRQFAVLITWADLR